MTSRIPVEIVYNVLKHLLGYGSAEIPETIHEEQDYDGKRFPDKLVSSKFLIVEKTILFLRQNTIRF